MNKERHQIIKQLSSGGSGDFGCVYQARDTQLDRDIAIKRFKNESSPSQNELKEQLLTEAKILAGLRHPNIVSIYDVIENENGGDIIMELIDGDTLDTVIKKTPLDLQQFLFVAIQLLSAIATAHEHRVLHCGLKPSNIMLTDLSRSNHKTTVIDFGISPSQDETSSSKSGTQRIVGSIHFVAPEVIESNIHSEASDIYSIGCIFYYALTGQYPFKGDSPVAIMASHMRNDFILIRQHLPDLPSPFCQWLESHIQYQQDDRVESCRESLNALMQLEGVDAQEALSAMSHDSSLNDSMQNSLSTITKANLTLSTKQQEEFQAEFEENKRTHPGTTPQGMVPMAESVHQVRPQDMWYFSIDEIRKGPVPFSKICELIAEGFICPKDLIYQQRLGEWIPAIEIPEFKEDFQVAEAMPPRPKRKERVSLRNSQRIRAQRAAAKAAKTRLSKEEKKPFASEISLMLVVSCLAIAFLVFQPTQWQGCLLMTSLILILSSLILTRIRMNQYDARWMVPAILLPVLSDIAFAALKPKHGGQSFLLLVLGVALFVYCSSHRYSNDLVSDFNLEFVSELLTE
ncbi:MAG: serine/threonine protein kinase [Crocinitomicaceae bacterium]|jgi:serine/threonine protein kinase